MRLRPMQRASAESELYADAPHSADPSPQGGGEGFDDLLMIVRRVEALGRFLDTEDGRNLLAGYRRAANILRIEEKKDSAYDTAPDIHLLRQPEELALWEALVAEGEAAREAVAREDFEGAMLALSRLRPPVDAFFDKVTVNADDPALRRTASSSSTRCAPQRARWRISRRSRADLSREVAPASAPC